MSNDFVEIKTERLYLRTLTDNDVTLVRNFTDEFNSDGEALEWIYWVNRNSENEPRRVFYIWLSSTNQLIGRVYYHTKCEIDNEVEIGYGINEEHRNNGYATEAAKALIIYIFEKIGLETLSAIVDLDNISSRCVIEKLGFVYKGIRTVLFGNEYRENYYYNLHYDDIE